jgi:hypothetical protein
MVAAQTPTMHHKLPVSKPGQPPLKIGKVTAVRATAVPDKYEGTCPGAGKRINFKGTITATGPLEVKYTWVRSDGAADTTPHELKFTAAGTKQVSDYWEVAESYRGWEALKITAPNQVQSPHAAFQLQCGAKAKKPGTTLHPMGR